MSQTSLPPTPDDEPDFVNEDEAKKNRCMLHGGVLRNAVQTVCGHRFCEACIGPLLSAGVMCPANEEDCVWLSLKEENESPIHPDFSTRREVLNLKVYCQFKQFGCKTVTTWRQLQKHVESCEHRRTSCTNGCGQSVPVASLSSHLTDECERRMVDCKHCGESVVFSHQQSHWDKECPEMKISCPNNCKSKKFKRRQLSAHLKTCPNKPKKCRFGGAGCTFEARSVAEMDDHERDSVGMHMGLVAEQTAQLTLKLQEVSSQNGQENAVEVERLRNDNKMLQVRVVTLTERTINLENQLEELKRKMALDAEKFNSQLEAVQATMLVNDQRAMEGQQPVTALSGATTDVNKRLQRVEQQVDIHEIRLAEGDLRFQIIETTNYHGILMWKIKDYRKRKQEAINRKTLSLFSQPFYSDQFGYKMCARVYLNGDGIGKNTHLSLFFVVMRGEYDNLLPWPFRNKVTMMLLDQESGRSPLVDSFRPDPSSSSFQKPTSEMNVASGCPVFISHVNLETGPFLKEDAIYIKVMVDAHA